MSKKAWIIFAAICVVLLGGLVYLSSKDRVDVSNIDTSKAQKGDERSGGIADRVYGKADSKVVLIEYGDFQCPGCGAAFSTIHTLKEKYKDQLAFVFRNFPLASIHPNARAAAAAAEAAGLQNKYWEMHDKLYENQNSWGSTASNERTNVFAVYAQELGLNVDRFKTDLASETVNKKINFDQALGKKIGVNATPTFYLNDKKLDSIQSADGGVDPDKLEKVITDALTQAGIELPKE